MSLRVGELFVLGFRGREIPSWLRDFEHEFGLGGVIFFDYDCQKRAYDNNIHSPQQVRELCDEVSRMASRPLITVDQEGGKVRRLKEKLGFAPLPSAQAFNLLSKDERAQVAFESFREMRELGFHIDLTPVVDMNINPSNPDIGAVERSYSASAFDVRENVEIVARAASRAGLGLCLKHYPGLGGATVNSHEELTDLTGTITDEQLELFYELAEKIPGNSVLVSHGINREWDTRYPASMSATTLGRLRERLPDTLLLSDDLQMQGLQKILPSREASIQGIRAGLDMIVIGNNLMAEDARCLDYARALAQAAASDPALAQRCEESIARVRTRKDSLA